MSRKKCVPSSSGFDKLGRNHIQTDGKACDHAVASSFLYSYQLQSLSYLTKQNSITTLQSRKNIVKATVTTEIQTVQLTVFG